MGIHTGNAQAVNDNDQSGGYQGYTSMARVQRLMSAARGKLSEAEFTSAWEAGLKMTVNDAIDLALKTVEEIK